MVTKGMDGDDVPRDGKANGTTTIFVGNLPFDIRDEQLEKEFSEIGPIKRAFIVKDKDKKSQSRGCGYVQFVLQDDADKCVATSKTIGNRRLRLNFANKKPKHLKRKALAKDAADQNEPDKEKEPDKQEEPDKEKENDDTEKISTKSESIKTSEQVHVPDKSSGDKKIGEKSDLQRTIVLTGLTPKVKRKAFRILCEGFGEIEKIVYPVPERDVVTAFVRFKEYSGAIRATQKIPGKKVKKSGVLSACLLTKENKHPSKKTLQKSRLIIRNLSFKCEENDLMDVFSKFGKVINVNIPTKKVNEKTVKIGCAFVQFANTENAKVALNDMNLKEIKGRQVVLDWAVTKEMYKGKDSAVKQTAGPKKPEVDSKDSGGGQDNDIKIGADDKQNDVNDDASEDEDEVENNLEEKDDSDEDAEADSGDEDVEDDDGDNTDDDNGDDNEEDDDDNVYDDNDDDEEEEDEMDQIEKKPKREMKDAKEGKTVFIRNLSYNVDEDMLAEEFEGYGEIDYCKLVMDHESGRSKGTAFVKFKQKDSADKCMEDFFKKEKLGVNTVIDGRPVNVSLAVTKGKLGEMERVKSESKKETDRRNLYLAAEGIITRNSPAAEGLSDADFKKREKALAEKKAKLKNPNYFVSRTRLCVRNLPVSTDSDALRVAFMKHVPQQMKIAELKIMRSKDRRDISGMPRSLGYGFIELEIHEDALALLRATNNNPDIFGEKRRPIVEFSVENAKALKILELKKKRSDTKTQSLTENKEDDVMTKEEKKIKKEKIHEKRKKRIARYKRKREEKKLLNNTKESSNQNTVVENTKTDKTFHEKGLDEVTDDDKQNLDQNIKSGYKRKLPSEADEPIKRQRNPGKKKIENEEEKFSLMVKQYKQKLFGETAKVTKKKNADRWFQ